LAPLHTETSALLSEDFARGLSLKEKKVNRKLIRPSLTDLKDQVAVRQQRKKPVPPEQTNAENFYYVKQMQSKTPMVIVLGDGETIRGVIEWYDKQCIKVNRQGAPNLLIYKPSIKYLYKENSQGE
jgi:sRNA-binding regulator protein Hfq